jgi:lipid-A-disaccharide synthase
LVNLIMDQPLVLELIQGELTSARLQRELAHLITTSEQARIRAGYTELRQRLGEGGAPQRTAEILVADLQAHSVT